MTSRARKSVQGRETVPDPRFGGRPGQASSKWRPPTTPRRRTPPRRPAAARPAPARAAAARPAPARPTPDASHPLRISLPEHLHQKLLDIVAAERSLRNDIRFSPAEKIVELIRDYELPEDIAALIGAPRR